MGQPGHRQRARASAVEGRGGGLDALSEGTQPLDHLGARGRRHGGGAHQFAQRAGELLPVAGLQEEILFRIREDLVPRAGMYYISALNGGALEGEDDWGSDGEFDSNAEWEDAEMPRR